MHRDRAGTVVVDSNVKKVQHPTGGVVGEIHVHDGVKVAAGDLVMRLDETITRANLGIITAQLDELGVRGARLKAERDGVAAVELPPAPAARSESPAIQEILVGESTLFQSRRSGREGQKAQLTERNNQLREEIGGFEGQGKATTRELELVDQELGKIAKLWAKNLGHRSCESGSIGLHPILGIQPNDDAGVQRHGDPNCC